MERPRTVEYIWAHTTPAGIVWLWSQQTPDIQGQWLSTLNEPWPNFEPSPPPSSQSQPYGWTRDDSAAYPEPGYLSFNAVSIYPPIGRSLPPGRSSSGGSRRRRTRKTRRKSSRGRSRSRGHRIRRKKTHNRRHRR